MNELILSEKWLFLLLALAINLLASFTVFNMIGHQKLAGALRYYWMLNGAAIFGLGLWVSQFIIELATDSMIIMDWTTVIKLILTMVAAYVAFSLLYTWHVSFIRRVGSGLLMSLGMTGISYACLFSGSIRDYAVNVQLGVVALLVSFIGTLFAFYLFERQKGAFTSLTAPILGLSVSVAQLVNVMAITVSYDIVLTADRLSEYMGLLAIVLGIATAVIFAFSLLARYVDQRFSTMNERYRLLVENSIDTIAIIKEGRWEYVNRSGLAMFEAASADEFLNRSIYLYLQPKCHLEMRRILQESVQVTQPVPVELEWFTVTGKPLHTEVVPTPAKLPGKEVYQVIIRDISERKKNEELLINSEKLYVAGQLAAGIAHEIRNPLTSLKGFLQLLSSGRLNSKNYFDIMKSELNRIESIVSELLMLSKPQVYELSCNDIRVVMRETITLLEAQALLHSIEMEAVYPDNPLWVNGVKNQLKQVFINVLKNAIEAMGDGGIIRIECARKEEWVMVRIQDYGPGIPEEQMAKIGQPFYTTKDKGTGLGLMVSYKIVDNHQGHIVVDSRVGSGTTFDIVLPSATEEPVSGEYINVMPFNRPKPEGN